MSSVFRHIPKLCSQSPLKFTQPLRSYSTTPAPHAITSRSGWWTSGSPPNWYLVCGVPVGLYVGYEFYADMNKDLHKPNAIDHMTASFFSCSMGICCLIVWPVMVPGIIQHHLAKKN